MSSEGIVILSAKDKTAQAFKSASGRLKSFGSAVTGMQGKLFALAGAGGFGLLISQTLKSVDALAKTSDKLGIATENLAGLHHAAQLSGVSTKTFDMALQRMTRRLAEAAQGTGEAKNAIKELGLNAKELSALSPDKAFALLSDKMGNVASQGDRVRLAMKLFDSEGVALVNTMAMGADGLAAAQKEAEAFGTAISRVDAKAIENANDAILRAGTAISGVFTRATVELAPFISAFANNFAMLSKENNGFRDQVLSSVESMIKIVAFFADIWRGLVVTFKIVHIAFATMAFAILATWDKTFSPILDTLAKIPGEVGDSFKAASASLTGAAEDMSGVISGLSSELAELVDQEMPSAKVEAFLKAVREEGKKTAVAMVEQQQMMKTIVPDVPIVAENKEVSKLREQQAEKFNQMIEAHAGEMELMFIHEAEKLEFLNESLANKAISEHQYELGKTLMEEDFANKRIEIAEREREAKISAAANMANAIMTLSQNGNKSVFEGAKTAAKVISAIKTTQAAISAFADTPGPIWVKSAAFAAALATGIQAQQQIDSVSYGGGGGGGGGSIAASGSPGLRGAGGETIAVESAQQEPQEKIIRFPDLDPDSFMTVKGMFKMLNEATDRGYKYEAG